MDNAMSLITVFIGARERKFFFRNTANKFPLCTFYPSNNNNDVCMCVSSIGRYMQNQFKLCDLTEIAIALQMY